MSRRGWYQSPRKPAPRSGPTNGEAAPTGKPPAEKRAGGPSAGPCDPVATPSSPLWTPLGHTPPLGGPFYFSRRIESRVAPSRSPVPVPVYAGSDFLRILISSRLIF